MMIMIMMMEYVRYHDSNLTTAELYKILGSTLPSLSYYGCIFLRDRIELYTILYYYIKTI